MSPRSEEAALRRRLESYGRRAGLGAEDAQDLAQETMVQLHRANARGVAVDDEISFCVTVLRRQISSLVKSRKVRRQHEAAEYAVLRPRGDRARPDLSCEILLDLERLLPDLSEAEQDAVAMLVGGYDLQLIAEVLGGPRAAGILARLRKRLGVGYGE